MPKDYIMYGAPLSYFSGKARAYLDWARINYEERRASPEVYKTIILPRIGWPVIPVVTGPDNEIMQDTSDIIDTLDARTAPPGVFPDDRVQNLIALLFELLGDEWLILPAMHYRWKYNREFTYGEFGAMAKPDASEAERIEIGRKRATMFEGSLPILGIDARTEKAIEAQYIAFLKQMDTHFESHEMLLGSRPSIGDFGLYGPLYAHLFRDPYSGELMQSEAPNVARWVKQLRDGRAAYPGAFLPGGEVPATLAPVLATQFEEQFPVLISTAKALCEWARDKSAGEAVPRALQMHSFKTGGATGERLIFPFNLWMLQRPLAAYRALNEADKARADALLGPVGGEALSNFPDFPALTRKTFKLVLA